VALSYEPPGKSLRNIGSARAAMQNHINQTITLVPTNNIK